jgi:hypothetical protein
MGPCARAPSCVKDAIIFGSRVRCFIGAFKARTLSAFNGRSWRVTELYAHLLPDHLERARNVVNMTPGIGPAALEANDRWRAKRPSRRSAR